VTRLAVRTLVRLCNEYAVLSHTSQVILRIKEPRALYEEICRICVDSGHSQFSCVYLLEGQFSVRVAQAVRLPLEIGAHSSIIRRQIGAAPPPSVARTASG
jgi:hypothetical protein